MVEGKNLNSLNYKSGGYLYVKVRSTQSCTYVKCTLNMASRCPGYAYSDHVRNTLRLTRGHHHDENAYKQSTIVLRNSSFLSLPTTNKYYISSSLLLVLFIWIYSSLIKDDC